MSRIVIFICVMIALVAPVTAQESDEEADPPDYEVSNTRYEVSDDGREVVVLFSVYNSGGDASQTATVQLIDLRDSSNIVAETTIDPLEGGGGNAVDVPLRFPASRYDPGPVSLSVIVALESDQNISNNSRGINITVPEVAPQPQQVDDGSGTDTDDLLWWRDLPIDLSNTSHLAILAGFAAILMLMALFIKLFLGLFRRNPPFGNWQPPYATMPPLDPHSTFGRRQAWQQYAQNNIMPVPCQPEQIHARKVLLGMDGIYLSGWRVISLRMTQYDMYGRVSRSQVLASGGMVKRMTRAARRAPKINDKQLARRVRPVAKYLVRHFKKRINKRSAMLPIALDARLRGIHGEVRIMFELYECEQGMPRKIDYWEPEMTVAGRTIYETYTYTIFGQTHNESYRQFQKRLVSDLERVLLEMMRIRTGPTTPPTYAGPSAEAIGGTQPVEAQSPDEPAAAEDTDEHEYG